jgi:hypothetical protein
VEPDPRAAGTTNALGWLAAVASVIFAAAAVAAWAVGAWPATPLTLAIAAAVVLVGPLLALVPAHVDSQR